MFTALVFFGPRLAILVWWLINPLRFVYVDKWFITILAWLFIPWTLLMYMIVAPGDVKGFDYVIIALGVLADVASYAGGTWGNRNQIPGYAE